MAGGKHRKVDVVDDVDGVDVGGGSEVRKARSRFVRAQRRSSHVGLTSPDDALDVGETGAEARDGQQ